MPPSKPIHGLAAPMPSRVSTACVSAAAVKAPASIFPSSAMLITPERSEKSPPSAASTSGVAVLIVEAIKERVKMSLIQLGPQTFHWAEFADQPFEERLSGDEENDDSLQYLHNVLSNVFGKTVNVDTAMLQHGEQQRRENHADRMIATEQCDCDARESVVVREAVVITIAITEHFVDRNHAGEAAGDRHREHDLFADRDAAVLSRQWIASGRANLVAPLRAPEEQVDQ